MLDFVYENQTKIIFGKNALEQVGVEMRRLGSQVLMVSYANSIFQKNGLQEKISNYLKKQGITVYQLEGVQPNPRMELAYQGIRLCKEKKIEAILAIGGGSVIDTCKTIGMGACYDGNAWDFFTGTQAHKTLPVGVILTIPAAGSESSMDAVMTLEKEGLKRASCSAPFIRPVFSILDPQLTFSLPAYQTACGACDIIAHVLERYFTPTPDVKVTDRLCEGLIHAVMESIRKVLEKPDDYAGRAELMLAGTYAHNNIVGVGRIQDWASHGLGHEISAIKDTAHGATLAVMMPAWMKYVYRENVQRFAQFANRVFDVPYIPGEEEKMAALGIQRFELFLKDIGLPSSLQELGITEDEITVMTRKCHNAGNLKKLDENDIMNIYHLAAK